MTIQHIIEDIANNEGAEVAQQLHNAAVPITELRFEEQREIMKWMATQILEELPAELESGVDAEGLLGRISDKSGFPISDLFYGLQYAEEIGKLTVNKMSVSRLPAE